MGRRPAAVNAPVTTGLSEYQRTRNKRYRSPISDGTSPQTMAVDCAAYCGSISATLISRTKSAACAGRGRIVSGSSTLRHDEPGSNCTRSPP
jgi:hypothetical protein